MKTTKKMNFFFGEKIYIKNYDNNEPALRDVINYRS